MKRKRPTVHVLYYRKPADTRVYARIIRRGKGNRNTCHSVHRSYVR